MADGPFPRPASWEPLPALARSEGCPVWVSPCAGAGSSGGHDSAESGKTGVGAGLAGAVRDTTCHRLPVGLGMSRACSVRPCEQTLACVPRDCPGLGTGIDFGPMAEKAPAASRAPGAGSVSAVYWLLAVAIGPATHRTRYTLESIPSAWTMTIVRCIFCAVGNGHRT